MHYVPLPSRTRVRRWGEKKFVTCVTPLFIVYNRRRHGFNSVRRTRETYTYNNNNNVYEYVWWISCGGRICRLRQFSFLNNSKTRFFFSFYSARPERMSTERPVVAYTASILAGRNFWNRNRNACSRNPLVVWNAHRETDQSVGKQKRFSTFQNV